MIGRPRRMIGTRFRGDWPGPTSRWKWPAIRSEAPTGQSLAPADRSVTHFLPFFSGQLTKQTTINRKEHYD